MKKQFIEQGWALIEQRKYAEAISVFNDILKEIPQQAEAWHGLGVSIVFRGGKNALKEGLNCLANSVHYDPSSAESQHVYGRLLMDAGDREAAKTAFIRSYLANPSNNLSAYYICEIATRTGDIDLVEDYIDDAVTLQQTSVLEPYMYANLCLYLRNAERRNEAIPLGLSAIKTDPELHIGHYALGLVYYELDRFEEAEKYLTTATVILPSHIDTLDVLCSVYEYQDKFKLAIETCLRILKMEPQNHEMQEKLGYFYFKDDQLLTAKETYERYLKKNKNDFKGWNGYSLVLDALGDVQESRDAIQCSLTINPKNANAINNLAHSYKEAGDFDQAIQLFLYANEVDPNYVNAYYSLHDLYLEIGQRLSAYQTLLQGYRIKPTGNVALTLATSIFWQKDKEGYRAFLQQAVDQFPKHEGLLNLYFNEWETDGIPIDEILQAIKTARKKIPNEKVLAMKAAILLRENGRYEEYVDYVNNGLAERPDHPYLNLLKGSILEETDSTLAHFFISKALDLAPEDPHTLAAMGAHEWYCERESSAYDYLMKAIKRAGGSFFPYYIASKLSREVNPYKDQHFYLFLHYCTWESSIQLEILQRVAKLDAPMLFYRLSTAATIPLETMSIFQAELKSARKLTHPFRDAISRWQLNNENYLLPAAIINLYLGDPVESNNLLAFNSDEPPIMQEMLFRYYRLLAAQVSGIDAEGILVNTLKMVDKTEPVNIRERYYKAKIFHLIGQYEKAINLLQPIAKNFRPAAFALVQSLQSELKQNPGVVQQAKDSLFELTVTEELDPLFAYGLKPVYAGENSGDFLENIANVLYLLESEEIVAGFLKAEFAIEQVFSKSITFDNTQVHADLPLKEKLQHFWQRLVDRPRDQHQLKALYLSFASNLDPETALAKGLHRFSTVELFLLQGNYRVDEKTEFGLYLETILLLYENRKIKIDNAICLVGYLQYCMHRMPFMKENKLLNFFLATCWEMILDAANVPDLSWLEKLKELKDILTEENNKKDPPLKSYQEYLAVIRYEALDVPPTS